MKNIPKLRFPEFANSGEWEEKRLELLSSKISDGIHTTPSYDDNGKYYFINGNNLVNGSIVVDERTKKVSEEEYQKHKRDLSHETILLSINGTIGNISIYNDEKVVLGKSACYINIIDKKANKRFIINSLKTMKIQEFFNSELTGSTIKNLSLKTIKNTIIDLPLIKEQQKIAACLSSVDSLISAQSQKVELLKEHKKGLLQNLFPTDGESIPRLRFHEFVNDGEWERVKLNQLGKLVSGLTYSPNDIRENGLLVLRSSNVQGGEIKLEDNVYVRRDIKGANLTEPNDILICVRNGSKALIGKNALIPDNIPLCTHGAFMTIFRAKLPKFIYQLFQTKDYDRQVNADLGATINSINGGQFIKYEFNVPLSQQEQQKIADCLNSIDEQISQQTSKLQTLKEHKKALIQQLFPSGEVSNG